MLPAARSVEPSLFESLTGAPIETEEEFQAIYENLRQIIGVLASKYSTCAVPPTILSIGCGTAMEAYFLRQALPRFKYIGVDIADASTFWERQKAMTTADQALFFHKLDASRDKDMREVILEDLKSRSVVDVVILRHPNVSSASSRELADFNAILDIAPSCLAKEGSLIITTHFPAETVAISEWIKRWGEASFKERVISTYQKRSIFHILSDDKVRTILDRAGITDRSVGDMRSAGPVEDFESIWLRGFDRKAYRASLASKRCHYAFASVFATHEVSEGPYRDYLCTPDDQ